jgi:tetratricopeptide (TPR) repeat protein
VQLLDRSLEKGAIEEFLQTDMSSPLRVLWVEGDEGVGKTDLLRYALASAGDVAFHFEDGTGYHKCRRGEEDQNFAMLTPIVGALSLRHSGAFSRSTSRSTRRLPVPPLAQILLHLTSSLPYIKEAKALYDPEVQDERSARMWFLGLARDSHASSSLSTFLVETLLSEKPDRRVLFAIDDVAWLDVMSIRVLVAAARRLIKEGFEFLIVMTSSLRPLQAERGNQEQVRAALRDYPDLTVKDLQVENLGLQDTTRVLYEAGKHLTPEEERYVFDVTKGNFSELARILRHRDNQIRLMYEKWRAGEQRHPNIGERPVTKQAIRRLVAQHVVLEPVFAVLVILENFLTVSQILIAVKALSQDRVDPLLMTEEFIEQLSPAISVGALQMVGKHLIADSAALDAARSFLLDDGTYETYARLLVTALSQGMLGNTMGSQPALARAITIQTELSPTDSLALFARFTPNIPSASLPDREVLLGAARAFIIAGSMTALPENWNLGARLLQQLTRRSCYEAGVSLGRCLYTNRTECDAAVWFRMLSDLLTCMREAGQLEGVPSWSVVGEQLVAAAPNDFERCHAAILFCSALEHLGEYEAIRNAFERVRSFLDQHPDDVRTPSLAIDYRRNLGLAYFHGDVADEYRQALNELARTGHSIDELSQLAFEASLHNHIGLGHYHTGRVPESKRAFQKCLTILERLGVRTETPLNNLGAASLFEGNLEAAYGYLERARDVPIKPHYQTLSIDINLSVCLARLGKVDHARRLIEPIALRQRPIPDPAVLSHARVNYAFLLLSCGEYTSAAEYYALSNKHRFRFLREERARIRERLTKYCAARAGIIAGEDLGDMSFVDFREDGTLPVRRPYQLDLNSLYIV